MFFAVSTVLVNVKRQTGQKAAFSSFFFLPDNHTTAVGYYQQFLCIFFFLFLVPYSRLFLPRVASPFPLSFGFLFSFLRYANLPPFPSSVLTFIALLLKLAAACSALFTSHVLDPELFPVFFFFFFS
eukprot:TRINITY_DN11512_c2_g1_i2.p1 TRINITY_DN11512_c2_g1~~TRINITY_DN11512_c2_g1_i2.p1  ORF type:complete len:127 (+),score=2.36 TRINITY_DN11512_c2_g1_i2:76-456(+)